MGESFPCGCAFGEPHALCEMHRVGNVLILDALRSQLAERDAEVVRLREWFRKTCQCEECGEPATALYDTEGDGRYWLCDRDDAEHRERYAGWEVFRAALTLAEKGGDSG